MIRYKTPHIIWLALLLTALGASINAEIPFKINYQGRLTDTHGGPLTDTTLNITFSIYRSTGVLEWTSGAQPVQVTDGIFNYVLGSNVTLTSNIISRNFSRHLGLKVGDDDEIVPRTELVSVPYAYNALHADTTDFAKDIADVCVTHEKIADNAVGTVEIIDESITTADILNGSVYNVDIANGTITNIDINNSAAIEISKIEGTSVNLISDQTILGVKTFQNGIKFQDGTLQTTASSGGSTWSVIDSVLYTNDYWGLARGGAGNVLLGDSTHTHVNLGVACTTGTTGADFYYATVSGGFENEASGRYSTIGGGTGNSASGISSSVSGGVNNIASGNYSAISGGQGNRASSSHAFVGGGISNIASAPQSVIPGGRQCSATGWYSLAAGSMAKANHTGSVVIAANSYDIWSDSIRSGGDEQMVLRADGGMYITNTSELAPYDNTRLITTRGGAYLSGNGTDWTNSSDRNKKENFKPVAGKRILAILEQLEITQWNYKEDDESITHIGPVAQDFYALFGVGGDNKSISTVDPAGIALVAIQELDRKTTELERNFKRINELEDELAEVKTLLKKLLAESN